MKLSIDIDHINISINSVRNIDYELRVTNTVAMRVCEVVFGYVT